MWLEAPNGAKVNARESAVGALLANGFRPLKADAKKPAPKRRGSRKKV